MNVQKNTQNAVSTPTFYFNINGKVRYFLIIAIHQLVPMTLHIPFRVKIEISH